MKELIKEFGQVQYELGMKINELMDNNVRLSNLNLLAKQKKGLPNSEIPVKEFCEKQIATLNSEVKTLSERSNKLKMELGI